MPTTDEAFRTEEEADTETRTRVLRLRQEFEDFEINRKPDPSLRRDLEPGFLLPYLLEADTLIFGRWDYWLEATVRGEIPDRSIPPVDWMGSGHGRTRKMLETVLDAVPKHGSWQSMGGWEYFRFLRATRGRMCDCLAGRNPDQTCCPISSTLRGAAAR